MNFVKEIKQVCDNIDLGVYDGYGIFTIKNDGLELLIKKAIKNYVSLFCKDMKNEKHIIGYVVIDGKVVIIARVVSDTKN